MATNEMRREAAKRKLKNQQERRALQAKRRQRTALFTSVAVVVLVVGAVIAVTALGSAPAPDPAAAPTPSPAPTSDPAEPAAPVTPAAIPTELAALPVRPEPLPDPSTCEYPADGSPAKPVQPPSGADVPASGSVAVTLETSAGTVPLTLDRALAPCTVNSFVSLAEQGFFDASPCHRLTTDPGLQVLQCGDPTGTGSSGPGYTIPDEYFDGLTYGRGILAMANTGQPNSGGSQFFMVYGDGQLPPQYTAFGSIDPAGLQVIDTIAQAGHDGSFDPSPGGGAPVAPVTIDSVTIS